MKKKIKIIKLQNELAVLNRATSLHSTKSRYKIRGRIITRLSNSNVSYFSITLTLFKNFNLQNIVFPTNNLLRMKSRRLKVEIQEEDDNGKKVI